MQKLKVNGLSSWEKCYTAQRYESLKDDEEMVRTSEGRGEKIEITLES